MRLSQLGKCVQSKAVHPISFRITKIPEREIIAAASKCNQLSAKRRQFVHLTCQSSRTVPQFEHDQITLAIELSGGVVRKPPFSNNLYLFQFRFVQTKELCHLDDLSGTDKVGRVGAEFFNSRMKLATAHRLGQIQTQPASTGGQVMGAEFTNRHCSSKARAIEKSCLRSISQRRGPNKAVDRIALTIVAAKDAGQLGRVHQLAYGGRKIEQLEFTTAARDFCEYRNQFPETFRANTPKPIKIQKNLLLPGTHQRIDGALERNGAHTKLQCNPQS